MASIGAVPTAGVAPLLVNFSGAGSSDPDAGNTLTYFWTFGDGTLETATAGATTMHTYTTAGTYSASLRTRDNNFAFSAPDAIEIEVVGPPKAYFSVMPCRLLDTRDPNGPFGGPALAGTSTRSYLAPGRCGIPSGASAIATNLTVVSPTAPGDLRIFPSGQDLPTVSSINFSAGQVRTNNAVIALSPAGQFDVFCGIGAGGATHLVMDVLGYFQ
ncbi:MAG: PKD domain-containing protein [Acidobacteriota bacterium]